MKKNTLVILISSIFLALSMVSCSDVATHKSIDTMRICKITNFNSTTNECTYTLSIKSDLNDELGFKFRDIAGKYNINDTLALYKVNTTSTTPITPTTPESNVHNVINITNN